MLYLLLSNRNSILSPTMAPTKVGLLGASGETGSSILEGLVEAGNFVGLMAAPSAYRIAVSRS